jgi:hypothetical protein
VYSHVLEERDRAAASLLGRLFEPGQQVAQADVG